MSANRKSKAQSRRDAGAPVRPRSRASTPPYNPGLQKLIKGKQSLAAPLDEAARAQGFRGWHQRGYLPHYDAPGITQMVTLRLADSLPASRQSEWKHLLNIEDNRERRIRLEAYLDRGLGECWFGRPEIGAMAMRALRFFDGKRYALGAWVVMPNHIHLLVEVWEVPLAKLVSSWKGFIAHEANRMLGRNGKFWERECLDAVIRNESHWRTAVRYIENNPVKPGLVRQAKEWLWSSARYRDEYGRLPDARKNLPDAQPNGAPPSSAAYNGRM